MMKRSGTMRAMLAGLALAVLAVGPGSAQVRNIDPNSAIDADLNQRRPGAAAEPVEDNSDITPAEAQTIPPAESGGSGAANAQAGATEIASAVGQTYREDDVIGAAEACLVAARRDWHG